MLHFISARLSPTLILLSILTFNTQANSIPQQTSSGVDGNFNLLTNDTLFSSIDNIYNFIDFNIADGATLNISNSGPVYIYAQQSITLNGNIMANTADLHLFSANITLNGNININNLLVAVDGTSTATTPDISGAIILSGNPEASITSGYIDTTSIDGSINLIGANNTLIPTNSSTTTGPIIITPSPVPVPAAIWLMISGLLSFGLLKRRCKA